MNDIITKDDIIAHAIYPAIAGEFDSATEEAIEEAIFEVAAALHLDLHPR